LRLYDFRNGYKTHNEKTIVLTFENEILPCLLVKHHNYC